MYNYAFSLYFGCSLAWLIVSGSLDIRFYDQLAARGTSTENQWRLQQATCEHGDLAARKWMQKIETIERCFPMSTRFLDPTWCGFLCVHNLLGLEYVGICCNMLGFPTTTETTIETFPNWNPVGTKSDIWHAQIGFWHGGHAADVCIIFNKGSPLQNNCAWSNAYMLNISEYIYIYVIHTCFDVFIRGHSFSKAPWNICCHWSSGGPSCNHNDTTRWMWIRSQRRMQKTKNIKKPLYALVICYVAIENGH